MAVIALRTWVLFEILVHLFFAQPVQEPLTQAAHNLEIESALMRKQSMKQIMQWDDSLYEIKQCNMINLEKLPSKLAGEQVKEWIMQYAVPDCPLVNGKPCTAEYTERLMTERNLSAVAETVQLRYAVVTDFADVRSFPTADAWQETADGFDYIQETGFAPGECVAVCHQTKDGAWSFVRGEYYAGWVSSDKLAETDRQDMLEWLRRQKTASNCLVALDFTAAAQTYLPMGTVLPVIQVKSDGFLAGIPKADANGTLIWEEVFISSANDAFRVGYLPLTEEELRTQAERCLGIPYGWGDADGNPDCSSTIKAIYRCFGIRLPRNTSAQIAVPGTSYDLSSMTAQEKRALLQSLPVGTFLYCPGHIMFYWGTDQNGEPMMLHNTTRYTSPETGELCTVQRCVLTPVGIGNSAGTPYYEVIQRAVCVFSFME